MFPIKGCLIALVFTLCFTVSLSSQTKELILYAVDSHIDGDNSFRVDILVNSTIAENEKFSLVNYTYIDDTNFEVNSISHFSSEIIVSEELYVGQVYSLLYNIDEQSVNVSRNGTPSISLEANFQSSANVSRDPFILHLVKGHFEENELPAFQLYGKVVDGLYISTQNYTGNVPNGIAEGEYAAMFEDGDGGFTGITDLDIIEECCLYDDRGNNGGGGFETEEATFEDDFGPSLGDRGGNNCCPPNTLSYEYNGCNIYPEGFPCEETSSYFIWYDLADPANPIIVSQGVGHGPSLTDAEEGDYQLFILCVDEDTGLECEYTLDVTASCPVECSSTVDVTITGPLNNCFAQLNLSSCTSATTIEWYQNGQVVQSGGNTFYPNANGAYSVSVSGCPDCPVLTETFVINCFISCGCDFDISKVDCNFLSANITSGCQGYSGNWSFSVDDSNGSYTSLSNNGTNQIINGNGHYKYTLTKNGCPSISKKYLVDCVNIPVCPAPNIIWLQDLPNTNFTISYSSGPYQNILDNATCSDEVYLFDFYFQGINDGDQGLVTNVHPRLSIEDVNGNPLTHVTATDFPNDQDAIVIRGLENGQAYFDIVWCYGTSYAVTYHFNVTINCCPDRDINFSTTTQTDYCNSIIRISDDYSGSNVQPFNANIYVHEDNLFMLNNVPNFVRYYFDYTATVFETCNGNGSIINTYTGQHTLLGAFFTSASLQYINNNNGTAILQAGDHLDDFYYTNGFTGNISSIDLSNILLASYNNINEYNLRVSEWVSQISNAINQALTNAGYTPVVDFHIVLEQSNGSIFFKSYISEKANYIGCSNANFTSSASSSALNLSPSNSLNLDYNDSFAYYYNNSNLGCNLFYTLNFPMGALSSWLQNANYDYNYVDLFGNNPQLVSMVGDDSDDPAYTCSTVTTTTTITAEINNGCASPTYFWTTPNGNIVSDPFTQSIIVDMPGDYSVSITCDDGCTYIDTYTTNGDLTLPVQEDEETILQIIEQAQVEKSKEESSSMDRTVDKYKVYPNPTSDIINIQGAFGERSTIRLYDTRGRLMLSNTKTRKSKENLISLSTAKIAAGSYILEIRNLDKRPEFHKVIIAK